MQQGVDKSSKSMQSVAGLEGGIRERMLEQQKTLIAPVAGMSSKLDQMSTEFSQVRESIADLIERMNKMQTQILDVSNTMKVLNQPPAPPPSTAPLPLFRPRLAGMSAKQLIRFCYARPQWRQF
ncbi:MAG: hypothetical protein WKF37_06515 [Bryobacteraceae bacterium]